MDEIPLIPKSSNIASIDISPVIGDVFQEVNVPTFEKNVAQNVDKFMVENHNLKASSAKVVGVFNDAKLSMEDIAIVENSLMIRQGVSMNEKYYLDQDKIRSEHLKLKRKELILDLCQPEVDKYGLLQKEDFLPIKPERSMDFRINSNHHLCKKCPSNTDNRLEPLNRSRKTRIPIRLQNNSLKKIPTEEVFRAEPNEILFDNFELDVNHEKIFKLRNVSRTKQSFLPSLLPKNSVFKVVMHPKSNLRLAPGMCAIFTVNFKIDIFENHEETITFRSQSASVTTVKISCFRKPPNLKIYIYKDLCRFFEKVDSLSISNFKLERNVALNSTIDCGGCFVGNTLSVILVLRNEGSTGKFFFVTEEDWYTDTIQSVSEEMAVELPHFTIFPSFFKVVENHFIEVIINFFPSGFGVEVEKFFLLCDNNALQDIEIIGDGVTFNQDTVVIEADFGPSIEEETDNDSEVDEITNEPPLPRTIDFGDCLPNVPKTRIISVHNNSIVELYYKWAIKYPIRRDKSYPRIKPMDSKMMKIGNVGYSLPANSTTEFPVTLLTNTNKLSRFGLVLIFYVLDIPEVALADGLHCWVREEAQSSSSLDTEDNTKRLNLIVGEVELLCNTVELEINFDPPDAIFSTHIPAGGFVFQPIKITSNCTVPLKCVWNRPKKSCIFIEPETFTLYPDDLTLCTVSVYLKNTKTIRDTLKLSINDGLYKKSFRIKVRVSKPMAVYSKGSINFGNFYRDTCTIVKKKVFVKNTGYDKLEWKLFEFYYNSHKKVVYECKSTKHLSTFRGSLRRQAKSPIIYTANINSKYHHRWVSCMVLISLKPKAVALDTCVVMYQLSQPHIKIQTELMKLPVVCPQKVLFLNEPEVFNLNLYNTNKILPGAFYWGTPIGHQAQKMNVVCEPKAGIVPGYDFVPIKLTVTPLETGVMENVVLPCFVGHTTKPLLLPIVCAVDNIHLHIYLPSYEDYLIIYWPPKIVTSLSHLHLEVMEEESENEEYQDIPEEESPKSIEFGSSSLLCPSLESIVQYTAQGMQDYGEEEEDFDSISNEWQNLISFKESKSLTLPPFPVLSLQSIFSTEVYLHDYVVEFRQVPLKTPVKKMMVIDNLTPVCAQFLIECANFYGTDESEDEKNSTNILYKLNISRKDPWEDIIDGELGLVVKISPLNGVIGSHQRLELDIWVYANTWGTYLEEVTLEVNGIQPFCFNILVEAIGIPIEFPIACNSIRSSPVLRFGNIPYLSDPVTRKLTVKNTSSIPISLSWHVFLCKPKSPKMRRCAKKPFNVVLDAIEVPASPFSAESYGTDFKLMVTPVNYGIEDDKIFQISPQDLLMEPKSSAVLSVTVNPQIFQPQYNKTFIEARLIAHLHLNEQHSFQSNLFKRLSGTELPPAKAKLLATIEMPLLKLELVKGETRIKAYANDIIQDQEVIFERLLVFKNYETAPIMVYMHTSNPFQVVYLHTKGNPKKKLNAAEVLPQECVEVLVRCTIDGEAVLQYSNMLFNEKETIYTEVPNFSQQSITLQRSLNIHQYGLKQQITNLEITLFYPKLDVSHEFIDFGVVFVGGTKKSLLTLSNPTGSHVPFNIQSNAGRFLTIVPSNGIVPKAIGITPSSVIVSLYFMPKQCQVFQETIRVVTNMPLYNFQVNIMGTGSNNEKFLNEGV